MKKLLIVLLLAIAEFAHSQGVNSARVTVFKSVDDRVKNNTKSSDSLSGHEKNCIKWNYSVLLRGVFLLNYERRVVGNLTVEVGLGLTYRDFVFEFIKGGQYGGNNNDNGGLGWDSVGTPQINLCGEIGARYYMSGYDNMEGFYSQLTFSYRPYSFPTASDARYGSLVPGYSFFDTQFKVGYQYTGEYSDITYDAYIGIGYRSANINYYDFSSSYNSNIGAYVNTVTPVSLQQAWPQFLMGFKIGYAF